MASWKQILRHVVPCGMALCGACSDGTTSPAPEARGLDGTSLLSDEAQAYAASLKRERDEARAISADELEAQHDPGFAAELGYDPLQAEHLALIQDSALQLGSSELSALGRDGFALSGRQRFPTFAYGYATIYAEDLPVFISADSILDALHRSYDELLFAVEQQLLRDDLTQLLNRLLERVGELPADRTRDDLTLYFSVADALLRGAEPDAGGSEAKRLVELANAGQGIAEFELFGVARQEDTSQFVPRGHYARELAMQQYFRAMMWLGRIDFRLVETLDDGSQVVRRPQIEAALRLDELIDAESRARVERIEKVLQAFVGASDNMTPEQLPALRQALGIADIDELQGLSDERLMRVILEQGFGKQQIASHLLAGSLSRPQPLGASFLLFGQRYTPDAHVLSNVSWDRTRAQRMLPDALDVAFAALGNDQAAGLLHEELAKYDYAGELLATRVVIDAYEPSFWQRSLYNDWLSALRALSPDRAVVADPAGHGSPTVTGTEAWGRRILNTQLASWAQLRHDTLLYAKQSYTSTAVCEFPDAAVEPYPEFFATMARFADHGTTLVTLLEEPAPELSQNLDGYLRDVRDIAVTLQGIAEAQRDHRALSDMQLQFVNDAVVVKREPVGCTSVERAHGWYSRLFFGTVNPLEFAPTIADVHTQPTDEQGTIVGRVLHVGTAQPMLMVVTLDGCEAGPRAYVGLAASFHERTTENFKRLTDMAWASEVQQSTPEHPAWLSELVSQ